MTNLNWCSTVELCKNGYAVFICDLLGHGNSVSDDSELGYFGENGVESLVDDMKQLNDIARREYPGLPVYLFGHSMGSFLSRAYTAKYPDTIDGTIWCGTSGANPAAGLGIALARAIEKRSGDHHRSDFLNSLAFGKYNKRTENETQFDWLSKDKEEVKKYIDDDYCGFVFTANGFETLFSLLKQISGNPRVVRVDYATGDPRFLCNVSKEEGTAVACLDVHDVVMTLPHDRSYRGALSEHVLHAFGTQNRPDLDAGSIGVDAGGERHYRVVD